MVMSFRISSNKVIVNSIFLYKAAARKWTVMSAQWESNKVETEHLHDIN